MIQILALRPYQRAGQTLIAEKWFEKKIRSVSVESVIQFPEKTVDQIETSELWNVYYTVCECLEEPGRKFLRQSIVPFDIDGLDLPFDTTFPKESVEQALDIACKALGVHPQEVGTVFSGNGVQILIPLDQPFDDREYFDNARHHYRACCDKIDLALGSAAVKGKADPSVWSPARLLRHPETWNRKQGKPERKAQVINDTLLTQGWSLEKASGLPDLKAGDHLNPGAVAGNFTCDPKAILDSKIGCDFLKFGFTNQEKLQEPLWYAGLSITGRFPEGVEWSHKWSKGHLKYNFLETEMKRKQATSDYSGPRTCKNIEGLGWDCKSCPQYGKVHSPITIEGPDSIKTLTTGFRFKAPSDENGKQKTGPADYRGLWRFFQRSNDYVSVSNSPEMYSFGGTHWDLITGDDVKSFAQKNFRPEPFERERNEFYSFVKISNLVKRNHFEELPAGLFNFANGVFDIADGSLAPHSKSYAFRHVLPCEFDVNAKAPIFEKFMSDVTCNRPKIAQCLQEYMGYIIAGGDCEHEKALILLGGGANGKSTFVRVLQALVGSAASSLSGGDILDPAKRLALVGKILNVAEENSRDSFRDVSVFKNLISGGVTWAKQLYSQPFEFKSKAKLIFVCNELPRNYDNSDGFYRKLLLIPFDARFVEGGEDTDIKIIKKLLTELPGIFNYAIEGYKRLVAQERFTLVNEGLDIIDQYLYESDHVRDWIKEEMEIITADQVRHSFDEIYNFYKTYCQDNGIHRPEARNQFFPRLKRIFESMGIRWKESKLETDGFRKRFVYYIRPKGPGLAVVIDHKGPRYENKD